MAYLWLLSRTPTIDDDTLNMAKGIISEQLPNWDFNNWLFDEQATSKCRYPDSVSDEIEFVASLV